MYKLQNWLLSAFCKIYQFILKQEPEKSATEFFLNILHLSVGTFFGGIILFFTTTIAGRLLTPSDYGNFSLIDSIARLLIIPMSFGLTQSLIMFNSSSTIIQEKKHQINTIILLAVPIINTIIFAVFWYFSNQFAAMFKTSRTIFQFSIIFAATLNFSLIPESYIKGIKKFKFLSLSKFFLTVILLFSFLSFYYIFKFYQFHSFVYAYLAAYISIAVISLIKYPFIGNWHFDIKTVIRVVRHGVLSLFIIIAGFLLLYVDRLMLNYFHEPESVGIYSAYAFLASIPVNIYGMIFNNVFLPTINSFTDKRQMIKKLIKIISVIVFLSLLSVSIIVYIGLNFYGNDYPLNLFMILLFSLNSTIWINVLIFAQIIYTDEKKGIIYAQMITFFGALLNICFNYYLIQKYVYIGAIIATIMANSLMLILVLFTLKNLFFKKSKNIN